MLTIMEKEHKLLLETDLFSDKYIQYIIEKYDLQQKSIWEVDIPLIDLEELNSFTWNIGLICGSSGSGKSTLLQKQFGSELTPTYDESKPIISQFENLEPEEVCSLFESVGLSSVPVWLHFPQHLSVGEKARLDLCWRIINTSSDSCILIDEFTSTVNRECAKSMAYSLQRYIRNKNLKIVISSCHFDIIDYISHDWIFNLNKHVNGKVELERIKYLDNYKHYEQIHPKNSLTAEKEL